jgi:hypothetical protein
MGCREEQQRGRTTSRHHRAAPLDNFERLPHRLVIDLSKRP